MGKHILIVDDDHDIAVTVSKFLARAGFETTHLDHGEKVLAFVADHSPDLVLLDVMLPGKDGITLCREIRAQFETPIFMLTGCVSEQARIEGLSIGADDYICKPFSAPELVLRVQAFFRRFAPLERSGILQLDEDSQSVTLGKRKITLTQSEFSLLALLRQNPKKTWSRDAIIDRIYSDYRIVTDRTIDSHVRNLRHKLSSLGGESEFVKSVYGKGYRYEEGT